MQYDVKPADTRLVAHALADFVQEKLTGTRGRYTERGARISHTGSRYVMSITDSDGADGQAALRAPRPILMPTWLADRRFLAYVSLETTIPTVWMHEVNSGMREPAASATSLARLCPSEASYLSSQPELNPPPRLLDDGWESTGGQACKAALLSLADRADAALARRRLGLPARPAVKPESELTWSERVARTIRRNVVFDPPSMPGNPAAEIRMKLAPDGSVLESSLEKSSGVREWDDAALRATRKTERLPVDANGWAPPVLILHMRPLQ